VTIRVIFDSQEAVTRYTRAGGDGRLIYCPHCGYSRRVYNFSWAAMRCGIKKCGKLNYKGTWLINPPTLEVT